MQRLTMAATVLVALSAGTACADEKPLERAEQALARWNEACGGKIDANEPCIKPRSRIVENRCKPTVSEARVLRHAKRAKKAASAITAALSELGGIERDSLSESERDRHDSVLARVRLAEGNRLFEELVTLRFPTGLDFSPESGKRAEQSKQRFVDWLEELGRRTTAAANAYQAAGHAPNAPADVRNDSCRGWARTYSWMASQLEEGEIPADVRTGEYAAEGTKAYCDQLAGEAEPLRAKVKAGAKACAEP